MRNPYGVFKVETEDIDGNIIDLGIHTGYIDDIAFTLTEKCKLLLRFEPIDSTGINIIPTKKTVDIMLDYDSETWDMTPDERVEYFKEMLKGRDVGVFPSTQFGCIKLLTRKETVEEKRQKALGKLTAEEKKLLGLE